MPPLEVLDWCRLGLVVAQVKLLLAPHLLPSSPEVR